MSFRFLPFETIYKNLTELNAKVLDQHKEYKYLSEQRRYQLQLFMYLLDSLKKDDLSHKPDLKKNEIATSWAFKLINQIKPAPNEKNLCNLDKTFSDSIKTAIDMSVQNTISAFDMKMLERKLYTYLENHPNFSRAKVEKMRVCEPDYSFIPFKLLKSNLMDLMQDVLNGGSLINKVSTERKKQLEAMDKLLKALEQSDLPDVTKSEIATTYAYKIKARIARSYKDATLSTNPENSKFYSHVDDATGRECLQELNQSERRRMERKLAQFVLNNEALKNAGDKQTINTILGHNAPYEFLPYQTLTSRIEQEFNDYFKKNGVKDASQLNASRCFQIGLIQRTMTVLEDEKHPFALSTREQDLLANRIKNHQLNTRQYKVPHEVINNGKKSIKWAKEESLTWLDQEEKFVINYLKVEPNPDRIKFLISVREALIRQQREWENVKEAKRLADVTSKSVIRDLKKTSERGDGYNRVWWEKLFSDNVAAKEMMSKWYDHIDQFTARMKKMFPEVKFKRDLSGGTKRSVKPLVHKQHRLIDSKVKMQPLFHATLETSEFNHFKEQENLARIQRWFEMALHSYFQNSSLQQSKTELDKLLANKEEQARVLEEEKALILTGALIYVQHLIGDTYTANGSKLYPKIDIILNNNGANHLDAGARKRALIHFRNFVTQPFIDQIKTGYLPTLLDNISKYIHGDLSKKIAEASKLVQARMNLNYQTFKTEKNAAYAAKAKSLRDKINTQRSREEVGQTSVTLQKLTAAYQRVMDKTPEDYLDNYVHHTFKQELKTPLKPSKTQVHQSKPKFFDAQDPTLYLSNLVNDNDKDVESKAEGKRVYNIYKYMPAIHQDLLATLADKQKNQFLYPHDVDYFKREIPGETDKDKIRFAEGRRVHSIFKALQPVHAQLLKGIKDKTNTMKEVRSVDNSAPPVVTLKNYPKAIGELQTQHRSLVQSRTSSTQQLRPKK